MTIDWKRSLVGQLEFYWDMHLWPRLQGLTDEEYLWEPVKDCWTIRPVEDGTYVADWVWPPPDPAPVTTIAWRMYHIAIGHFAERASAFFGDGSITYTDRYTVGAPGTAAGALAQLEEHYTNWHDAIAALDDEGMAKPLGERGGPYAQDPMAGLIFHINREVMHHGGEIGVLRDLYRAGISST
jgi:hypothetical protein